MEESDNLSVPEEIVPLKEQFRGVIWETAGKLAHGNKELFARLVEAGFLGLLMAGKRWNGTMKRHFNEYACRVIRRVMFTAAVSKVGDNNLHPEDMEALTKQYQRLVWKIAHKLARGDKEMYVEFVQDGFLGLLEAAKRWSRKKARKTRFNTYAYIAIRHAMITAVGTRQTKAFCADCKAKEEMISLRESFRGMICPVCGAQSPREQRCHDVSLDDEIVAGLCMREVLPFKGLSPDALAERAEIEERIQALPERLRYVITERLDGKTLKGLGLSMDITRERIRQRKKMPSTA